MQGFYASILFSCRQIVMFLFNNSEEVIKQCKVSKEHVL